MWRPPVAFAPKLTPIESFPKNDNVPFIILLTNFAGISPYTVRNAYASTNIRAFNLNSDTHFPSDIN